MILSDFTKRRDDIVADMVANIEVHMVADIGADMVLSRNAPIVAFLFWC